MKNQRHMTLLDEKKWKQMVAANPGGTGGKVIRYAERWACSMESRMANGDTLEACAEETSSLLADEDITGAMYGCALDILSQVWIHGEQLRRWHNLHIQIEDGGERANAIGGMLNPAIVCFG